MDVRVPGGRARHLAGSMCRFAVQRVLDRAFWNVSAPARASAAAVTASSRSISRARRRSAAASCKRDGRLARFEALVAAPEHEGGKVIDAGHEELPRGAGRHDDVYPRGAWSARRRGGVQQQPPPFRLADGQHGPHYTAVGRDAGMVRPQLEALERGAPVAVEPPRDEASSVEFPDLGRVGRPWREAPGDHHVRSPCAGLVDEGERLRAERIRQLRAVLKIDMQEAVIAGQPVTEARLARRRDAANQDRPHFAKVADTGRGRGHSAGPTIGSRLIPPASSSRWTALGRASCPHVFQAPAACSAGRGELG